MIAEEIASVLQVHPTFITALIGMRRNGERWVSPDDDLIIWDREEKFYTVDQWIHYPFSFDQKGWAGEWKRWTGTFDEWKSYIDNKIKQEALNEKA